MEITDEKIDDIINSLDGYARDYDYYEYGLPIYESEMDEMRAIVRAILNKK